jgi:iron complex outermembrane receptor protein
MLPSANVSDADPYGLMPGQSYVRGLDSSEMAWVMEGAPLNDMSSGAFYAEEYVEAEDLKSVSLQPGSVNISTPTVNATAGQVIMTLQDPTHKFGGLVDFSAGSDNLAREYIRVNTGDIGNTGIRGWVSYSHTYADNWTGVGHAEKHHVNAKFVKDDWANGSKTALVVAYNNEVANFYANPTLAQFGKYGNSYNYAALPGTSSYYKLQVNPFANFSASMPTTVVLSKKLTLNDTPTSGRAWVRALSARPPSRAAPMPATSRSMSIWAWPTAPRWWLNRSARTTSCVWATPSHSTSRPTSTTR